MQVKHRAVAIVTSPIFIKKFLPFLFYFLLLLFLLLYLKNIDFSQLKNIHLSWTALAIATVFALAFRYWGAFIWLTLLKGLGAKDLSNKTKLVYVYAKSWMGRYIPGTAPWILGKIYFASRQGISKNKLAVSSLLEGALQVVVVMFMAFILLFFDKRLDVVDPRLKLLIIIIMLVLAVAMIPAVFNKLISFAYRILRRKKLATEHLASTKLILTGVSLYAVGSFLIGFSFFFIAKAVYPELSYENILFVMGVSNLAAAVSMLAIFAPSGLGVREGIQLVLLSIIIPKEFALVIVVVTRIWSVIIDLLFFAISKFFARENNKINL